MCDLMNTEMLPEKIRERVDDKNRTLAALKYPQTIDPGVICESYTAYADQVRPYVTDTTALLNGYIRDRKSILFEGAQATLLDVDHGTYPFVTSSSSAAGGVATGLGVSPKHVHAVIGITKAYSTRVGAGPFPTEANDGAGDELRKRGVEYGSTTGRPRRCGWFDGPAVRYATEVNALDSVIVTKIDVLDSFTEIPFCVDYRYKGATLPGFPADSEILARVEPVYKPLRGWNCSTAGIRDWSGLPAAAQDYLKFLSDYLETPLSMVSTGSDRDETIHL
jgi:adenylosuccinate synthase